MPINRLTIHFLLFAVRLHGLSLQAEQTAIRISNDEGNRPLSWSQIRTLMPVSNKVRTQCKYITCIENFVSLFLDTLFSQKGAGSFVAWGLTVGNYGFTQVVLESLRMASIISFTFREAVADVEYKGNRST